MRRLPAEWEPQSAVMLTWPHADTDWHDQLPAIEALYVTLAAEIAAFEAVIVVCRDPAHREHVARQLDAGAIAPASVFLALAASNDTWSRDHGPITVVQHGRARLIDFRFNGWGGKFPATLDDRISASLHAAGVFGDVPLDASELVLEGGAIESDGMGTLLAVTRTLVDAHRNPGLGREDIEAILSRLLGTRRYLWLESGQLTGDDTDGHIDTLARFCAPDSIAYVHCEDRDDPDYPALAAMERELRAFRQTDGRPYRLTALPHPAAIQDAHGRRLPASYANFLIVNGAVLTPTYGDPFDGIALQRLGERFPSRQIRPIDCRAAIEQGGSLHCLTMQLPAPLAVRSVALRDVKL